MLANVAAMLRSTISLSPRGSAFTGANHENSIPRFAYNTAPEYFVWSPLIKAGVAMGALGKMFVFYRGLLRGSNAVGWRGGAGWVNLWISRKGKPLRHPLPTPIRDPDVDPPRAPLHPTSGIEGDGSPSLWGPGLGPAQKLDEVLGGLPLVAPQPAPPGVLRFLRGRVLVQL